METSSVLPLPTGVRWARLAGCATGVFLIGRGLWLATGQGGVAGQSSSPVWVAYGIFVLLYGGLLVWPWLKVPTRAFLPLFGLLIAGTLLFAFGQIAEAMFGIHAMAAIGRKPGLPAFQGTLVFLSVLQVPTVLFARRPELLR